MGLAAEKIAEAPALPEQDRAYLAHQLIASLGPQHDANAETEWGEVLDRRSQEIEEGLVTCRLIQQVIEGVRARLDAHRRSSPHHAAPADYAH